MVLKAVKEYRLKAGVIYQDVGEEALLLNEETEEVFSLNPVGKEIWQAVQRCGSIDGAVSELIRCYQVDAEVLRLDAIELLESVRKAGLLL